LTYDRREGFLPPQFDCPVVTNRADRRRFFGSCGSSFVRTCVGEDAGPIAEKSRIQQVIQLFASLGFLAILVLPSLDHRFSWSHVPLLLVLAGDLLVVLGFYIVFRVFCVNTFTAATVVVTEQQTVISTGPYAFVRHPMYSGALTMLLGAPLALACWWGLIPFVLMVAIIVIRLLDEERLLLTNLSGYAEYVATVKYRLIPHAW
jgi:protein-S-isoprenylcysteine O-methyltransferase Ste14